LADDLEELIDRLSRNTQTWCTYAHQEMSQMNPKAANLFMKGLASQLLGRTADPEAAALYARRFYRWDPRWVRKTVEQYHPPTTFADEWVDVRTEEYSRDEQVDLQTRRFLDLPTFSFYLGVAPREGELPTHLERISIADYDRGQYVQEEQVAATRALLTARHPRVPEVLAGITARLGAIIPLPPRPPVAPILPVRHVAHHRDVSQQGDGVPLTSVGVKRVVPSGHSPDERPFPAPPVSPAALPLQRKTRATPLANQPAPGEGRE
jgi:hypothetical protein